MLQTKQPFFSSEKDVCFFDMKRKKVCLDVHIYNEITFREKKTKALEE